jgi:hypothetical protein
MSEVRTMQSGVLNSHHASWEALPYLMLLDATPSNRNCAT